MAANSELRATLAERAAELGVRVWIPARELCTDNAAMIAAAARFTEPLRLPGLPGPGRGRQAGGVKLTFYGKAGCHLCEEAYAEVRGGPGRGRGSSSRYSTFPWTRA